MLLGFDQFLFDLGNIVQYQIHSVKVDFTIESEIITQSGELVLIDGHNRIDGSFSDVERGGVGEEIVANEKAEEHKIIDYALEIERERELNIAELKVEILSDNIQPDELEAH